VLFVVAVEVNKDIALQHLGNRIKKIRLSKKLTQVDLASRANKDQQSIQRLEKGRVNPSYVYLLEICAALGVSLSDIDYTNKLLDSEE
jgi:transcriptional regulator with XRE-family HTH domain